MQTVNTNSLTLKPKAALATDSTPNGAVRKALLALKPGEALYMQDLATDMAAHFTLGTDDLKKRKMRAYIRVGEVYKKLSTRVKLAKFKDSAGFTLIGVPMSMSEAYREQYKLINAIA